MVWLVVSMIVAIACAAFEWSIVLVKRKPALPTLRRATIAEYTPPAGVTVVTASVFERRTKRALAAFIIDHGVRGAVRILDRGKLGKRRQFGAQLVDRGRAQGVQGAYLLAGLFSNDAPGATVDLGGTVTGVRREALSMMWTNARSRQDDYVVQRRGGWYSALTGVVIVCLSSVFISGLTMLLDGALLALVPIGLTLLAASACWIARATRIVTVAGAELAKHLAGLREFISVAEADRIRMLQSASGAERVDTADAGSMVRLYEPLLPWAMIFGLEQQWNTALGTYYADLGEGAIWYGYLPVGAGNESAGFNVAQGDDGSQGVGVAAFDAADFGDVASIGEFAGLSIDAGGFGDAFSATDFAGSAGSGDYGGFSDGGFGGDGGGGGGDGGF